MNENAIFQVRVSFDNFTGQFVKFLLFPPDILKRIGWECVSHGPAGQTVFKAALPCSHNCDWNSLSSVLRSQEKISLCIISIFLLPPLAADGFGWSLAEGRASACCNPSFWCLEAFPCLSCDSVIPALLACPELKEIVSLSAKRKSLQSQSTRDRFLNLTAVHGTTWFFFSFGEAFGIWGCLSGLPLPILFLALAVRLRITSWSKCTILRRWWVKLKTLWGQTVTWSAVLSQVWAPRFIRNDPSVQAGKIHWCPWF